jgi:hypothetical protein
VATEGVRLDEKLSPTLLRRAMGRSSGLAGVLRVVLFGVVLFAVGCGANSGSAGPTSADKPEGLGTGPQRHGPTAGQKPNTQHDSRQADTAQSLQGTGSHIPSMNANAVLTTLLKPGLECWQPITRGVLYRCSGEENPDLTLLYEGEITGRTNDKVNGVDVRVFRRDTEDFEQDAQPFLGMIATQLKYRGADKNEAYKFVNQNLSSDKATTTIGEARWTMTSSDSFKELTVRPA